jgi:CRP-like cAMP-binding protein
LQGLFTHIDKYHVMSKQAKEALLAELQKKELSKNDYLHQEGRVCSHLYYLEKGCLRGYYNIDGKELTYWFGFENDFVGSFYSFISRKPSFENVQCLEDCTLWGIAYEQLQNLYNKYPEIERLGRLTSERYYVMLDERFLNSQYKTAKERYEDLVKNAPHILQRASLGHVASYLGISQETLSRIRSQKI